MMGIKNFNSYLLGGTKESMMRLLSFLMVVTACLGVIATIAVAFYQLFFKVQVDWLSMAGYVGSLGTFAGIGLAGKAYQKKIEDNTIIAQQQNEENFEIEKQEVIQKTKDGRQILND